MTSKVRNINEARSRRKPPSGDWAKELILTKDGFAKANVANTLHVLAAHPAWSGALAYDAFAEAVVKLRPAPMRKQDVPTVNAAGDWTEADSTRTAAWIGSTIGFDPAVSAVDAAVMASAERNLIHPVRDYLAGLEWDGSDRAELLFVQYFGAPDSSYTRAIGVRFLISAVARVMEPGCQADCMPVVEGAQGIRKSTGFEALFSQPWFSDSAIDVGSKDAYQALRHKWCHEFSELDSFKGRDVTRVKAFVSARVDTYRPSYGRHTRDFPRQIVFVGSTNEAEYLVDHSGNRRFWPVKSTSVDVEAIRRDRDQLWAEARVRYERGERLYLDTPELRQMAEQEQEQRVPDDVWVELVRRWLDAPTVPSGRGDRSIVNLDDGVSTTDVLLGALNFEADRVSRAAETRAGQVLRALGFEPKQRREGSQRVRRYHRVVTGLGPHGRDTDPAESKPVGATSQPTQPDAYTHARKTHSDDPGVFWNRDVTGRDRAPDDDDIERQAIQEEGRGC